MTAPAPASVSPPSGPTLVVDALCCVRDERVLFERIDFRLPPGHVVQLEGPNGAGKTTLLRAVCGLAPIEAGTVYWGGEPRAADEEAFRAALTYIGHVPGVKRDLTPRENLRASLALGGGAPTAPPDEAFERLGLAGLADTPLRRLSAGQARRAALARLLVAPTPLWILDEPLTALDPGGKALVEALVAEHAEAGGLALISTHQPLALGGDRVHGIRLGA